MILSTPLKLLGLTRAILFSLRELGGAMHACHESQSEYPFFLISDKLFERTWLKTSSTPIVKSNYTIIIGSLHTSELSWKRIGKL